MSSAIAGPGAPAMIRTGRSEGPRRSALGCWASARLWAAGSHSRATGPASSRPASSLAYPLPAAASAAAVKLLRSGPPSAMRTSGRLESASMAP